MSPGTPYTLDMSPKVPFDNMRKGSAWRADRPYNDLPELPPAVELETRAVLKQCVKSGRRWPN